jgi:hypothetical protein
VRNLEGEFAAHLEHLDERDAQVQVSCIAKPQHDRKSAPNGHNSRLQAAEMWWSISTLQRRP